MNLSDGAILKLAAFPLGKFNMKSILGLDCASEGLMELPRATSLPESYLMVRKPFELKVLSCMTVGITSLLVKESLTESVMVMRGMAANNRRGLKWDVV